MAGIQYERVCRECDQPFVAQGKGQVRRVFCLTCRPPFKLPGPTDNRRFCELDGCNNKLGMAKKSHARFCTKEHAHKSAYIKRRERKKKEKEVQGLFRNPDTETKVPQERQGWITDKLRNDSITAEQLLSGELTASALAIMWDVSTAGVTRAMQGLLAERAIEQERDAWQQSKRVQAMLPGELMKELKELGRQHKDDSARFVELTDHLVRCYSVFSRRYFNLEGNRPLIKDFHIRWIRTIIEAYATGGKRLILSPPRHGKSETLIRFVVWFIVMDPNIRIGWFCASRDVATLMLGSVKDILSNNEDLIRDVLPPGELFDPGLKSNKPWSAKEIKVAQQSHVGAKSSSLLALGRTSKFLSRDMDIIVIDDLEDYDSTREEGQRIYSRNKLAEIGTRKVEETAEIAIGSRQHPDDIPNHLLQLQGSILQWEAIVDSAHDENCGEDPDDLEAHWDCMLFPEVRSYRYLMEKKLEMETLGLGHLYPLRYLNTAIPADGQVFDVQHIREVGLDRERGIGLEELPPGYLVGGLDPSARGIQASFLWHYRKAGDGDDNLIRMSMVDLDEAKSGGVAGAVDIILDWYHKYDLTLWYYEVNSQQIEFYKLIKDAVAKAMDKELGHNPISIKEHSTGKNKQDAELGISAMAPFYHNGSVSLPYGTNEARRKTNSLLRQLELWTTDGVKGRGLTDIKMAQWFPFVGKILSFVKQYRQPTLHVSSESSYPDEGMTETPWASMYPGG